MELITVLIVIGFLASAAAFVTLGAQKTTDKIMGDRLLLQLATAQEEHFRQRGTWVTDPVAFSKLAKGATITNDSSTASNVVSINVRNTSNNRTAVGMAVLTNKGICVTLLLQEPNTSQMIKDSFKASDSKPCSGAQL